MTIQDRMYQVALTKVDGIGPVTAKLLIDELGSAEAFFHEKENALLKIPGISHGFIRNIDKSQALSLAEKEWKFIESHRINVLYFQDDKYPRRLRNIPDSPILLYVKGTANLNPSRTIAIVGTRQPTDYGRMFAEQFIDSCAQMNLNIVSGLAHGIDTLAHRMSLKNSIPTIGFMGGGFEKIYPAINRPLAERMQKDGAVITEFGFQELPGREHFPMRNRLIAAMADALIVVESKEKGGSMITADLANQYHKDVFALPGKINDKVSAGCNQLIKQNKAHLLESVKDLEYIMGWNVRKVATQMTLPILDLSEPERSIVTFLEENESSHIDKIHFDLKLPISSLSSLLLGLEFKGIVRALPGKCYGLN